MGVAAHSTVRATTREPSRAVNAMPVHALASAAHTPPRNMAAIIIANRFMSILIKVPLQLCNPCAIHYDFVKPEHFIIFAIL
jgi:hypothetical protein